MKSSTTPQTVHSLLATWAAVVATGLLTNPMAAWTTSRTANVWTIFVSGPTAAYAPRRRSQATARLDDGVDAAELNTEFHSLDAVVAFGLVAS